MIMGAMADPEVMEHMIAQGMIGTGG